MSLAAPTPAQRRAADPGRSVWVTANAGTGKTSVLTDRSLRLMLAGAPPESILCLTFTKAAAAEMTLRVERRLASWATHQDAELRAELEGLTGAAPTATTMARARQLFAQVLDLPRGLMIMTIHGFCGALLRRFPVEAGIAPHFEPIDERTAGELMAEAREAMLLDARDPDTAVGDALAKLAVLLADTSLSDALAEMLSARARLTRRVDEAGGIEPLLAGLWTRLGVSRTSEPILIERAFCEGAADREALAVAANLLAAKKKAKTQAEAGAVILGWLGAPADERLATLQAYRSSFVTQKGELKKNVASEALRRDHPDVVSTLHTECERLRAMEERIRALLVGRRTEALLRVGWRVIEHYEARKRHRAALDFDDLIERTRLLLDRGSDWVLYKLDQRIEHLLVDEAQDTSPAQWEIALRLSEEFFTGAGQHSHPRTLFVVGDEKQSIYSFQGADLANLRRVRARLDTQAAAMVAGTPATESTGGLVETVLDRSFRSTRAVLDLVDAVLALPEARTGVVAEGSSVCHDTARPNDAGLVELWPLAVAAEPAEDAEPWPLPGAVPRTDEPQRAVARAIAATIRGWLDRGERLTANGARIRAGDVMILLSRRGIAQEHLIRALKQAGLPVAGADRLTLTGHIAVMDLMALGRALLLPEDDLTFACLLKSPLVGLDDDDLMRLTAERGPSSLLERLRALAGDDPRLAAAYARIEGWLARADFMPPFEFFCHVLGPEGGRRRLVGRLGREALEPIEAFLGQCLAYESGHPASLEGFLHWLGQGEQELKRDPEGAADAVRVLTVHGAKGLEAPIVFLADAGPRGGSPVDRLIWDEDSNLPFWRARQEEREPLTQAAVIAEQEREADERRRLLYVALTRARDRLYITGWAGRTASASAWHDLCAAALHRLDGVIEVEQSLGPQFTGPIHRYTRGVPGAQEEHRLAVAVPVPLPTWATAPAPSEPPTPRPLAPSRLAADEPGHGALAGADAAARIRRGELIHRLLELLPALADAERAFAAERWLARSAGDLPAADRADLAAEVLAVLAMPALAPAFAPGSRAEQSLCGSIAGRAFTGQVDRLAVTADTVLVVDYKTGRMPPCSVAETPPAYLRQMAAYSCIVQELWPGRRVSAGLLWTQAPRLDLLPAALLAAHAPRAVPERGVA